MSVHRERNATEEAPVALTLEGKRFLGGGAASPIVSAPVASALTISHLAPPVISGSLVAILDEKWNALKAAAASLHEEAESGALRRFTALLKTAQLGKPREPTGSTDLFGSRGMTDESPIGGSMVSPTSTIAPDPNPEGTSAAATDTLSRCRSCPNGESIAGEHQQRVPR
jgi:hypothetical protein